MATSLFFSMLLISLGAMIAAGLLRSLLNKRFGDGNAVLIAAAAYIVVVVGVALALPDVNEVPKVSPRPCCGTSASRRSAHRQSCGRRSVCFSASSPSARFAKAGLHFVKRLLESGDKDRGSAA